MLGAIAIWDHKDKATADLKRFLFQCYDYTCRAYGAELVLVENELTDLAVPKVPTLEQALGLERFREATPVYVHQTGKFELPEFAHPPNAVYVVGPDYGGLDIPEDALSVRVPVHSPMPELWAHSALAIVLHSRYLQLRW